MQAFNVCRALRLRSAQQVGCDLVVVQAPLWMIFIGIEMAPLHLPVPTTSRLSLGTMMLANTPCHKPQQEARSAWNAPISVMLHRHRVTSCTSSDTEHNEYSLAHALVVLLLLVCNVGSGCMRHKCMRLVPPPLFNVVSAGCLYNAWQPNVMLFAREGCCRVT